MGPDATPPPRVPAFAEPPGPPACPPAPPPPSFLRPVSIVPSGATAKGLGADAGRAGLAGFTVAGLLGYVAQGLTLVGVFPHPEAFGKYGPELAGIAAAVGAFLVSWLGDHAPPQVAPTAPPDPDARRVP